MRETKKGPGGDLPSAGGLEFAIVASRFNGELVERLVESAQRTLAACGAAASAVKVWWAPGAFELPLLAQEVIRTARPDAVIALGAVVRGETPHFDFVAGEAARGLASVSRDTGVPVTFDLLTTHTWEQAEARTRPPLDRGAEAARAAVEMARTLAEVRARESVVR